MAEGADCVVTVGAIQSNHCRATAVAARHLGLDAHLILRCPREVADAGDPGFVGNLLVERAVGATIHVVSKREYAERGGGPGLTERVADRLRREGRRPYVIPVGGSDAVGGHGYLRFVDELERQCEDAALDLPTFTHIASACGSGGTTAGIALGCALCPTFRDVGVLAYGVCDAPEYFRAFCRDILLAQGAPSEKTAVAHWDSKHAKLPFVFVDWTDAHAASGGVTTQGAAVKGGKEKTVHELQKTAAGRAELARRQAEKERIANLQF